MDNESAEKQAHIVKAGDSLWKIVQNRYNGLSNAEISRKVNEIAALNELDDPGQIKAGDKLLFPTENIKHGSREYFLNISKALFAGEDPPLEPIQNSEHSDRATDEDMLPRFQQLTEDQRVMLVHYLDELYAHEIPQGSDIITFYREKVAADLLGKGPDRQALHDYIIADLDRASELQNHLFQEMGTGTSSEKTESLSEKDGKASSLNEAHNAEIAKTVEMGTVNVPDDTHPTAEELIADFSTRLENGEITIRDVKRELETRDIPDEIAQQVLVCEEIAGPESGSYEIHLVSAEQLVIDVQLLWR
ncbi:MAG: LysM domain-containing protein [Alphaproteobacteria bacterium]